MQQLTTEQLDQRQKQREAPKFFLYKWAFLSPLARSQAYSQCGLFNVAIQTCALKKIEGSMALWTREPHVRFLPVCGRFNSKSAKGARGQVLLKYSPGGGGTLDFKWWGWWNGKKNPWTKNLTPNKSHNKFTSLKILQKGKQVWLYFGCRTMWPGYAGTTTNVQIVLNAQKILTKFSYPKKSFDHPHHLKSGVSPSPPHPVGVPACIDDCLQSSSH